MLMLNNDKNYLIIVERMLNALGVSGISKSSCVTYLK